MEEFTRPDPDMLISQLKETKYYNDSSQPNKGILKIFFGYCAGVGKTYSMLKEAHKLIKSGVDTIVGYIEPHTRTETMALLDGLEVLPTLEIEYKNIKLREFDLSGAIERRPQVILVDELAHSNADGSRNKKRYQDIEELLNAGIDVYTTVNVQHIESLNDIVKEFTKIDVRETVPDYIFDNADKVKLVDIEPEELLKRFGEGKVYNSERAKFAISNFFTKHNLDKLREISMRRSADRIIKEPEVDLGIDNIKSGNDKIIVLISASPSSKKNIRVAYNMAQGSHCGFRVVYVQTSEQVSESKLLKENIALAESLGGEVVTLYGDDIALVVANYALLNNMTNIVIGKTWHETRNRKRSLEEKLIAHLPNIEIHIIPDADGIKKYKRKTLQGKNFSFKKMDVLKSTAVLLVAFGLSMLLQLMRLGSGTAMLIYILAVVIVSRLTEGYLHGMIASVVGSFCSVIVPYKPYFLITPTFGVSFSVTIIIAIIISALTVRIKVQIENYAVREQRTQVLYEINKKLLVTRGLKEILKVSVEYVSRIFKCSVIFYASDYLGNMSHEFLKINNESDFMLDEKEQAVAAWVFANKKRAGMGTDTLMGGKAFYMPVMAAQSNVWGVLGLACVNEPLSGDSRRFLRMIGSLFAMALERQRLSDEQRAVTV